MIADSTLALITGIDKSPASVKRTSFPRMGISTHSHSSTPVTPPVTSTSHSHSHSHAPSHPHPHADIEDKTAENVRIRRLAMFLEAHFGDVELHMPEQPPTSPQDEHGEGDLANQEPALLVTLDDSEAVINLSSMVRSSFCAQIDLCPDYDVTGREYQARARHCANALSSYWTWR
jgi:cleavage and polyadenylation specificity factor subunit 3